MLVVNLVGVRADEIFLLTRRMMLRCVLAGTGGQTVYVPKKQCGVEALVGQADVIQSYRVTIA